MRGYFKTFAGILAAGTVLAACSYVPDSVNPTTWKWSRLNPATWFESDAPQPPKPAQARSTLSERPASKSGERPFPSVNDTPGKPAAPSSAERRNIAQGLQADRDNARYTDEVLRAQSAQAAPPPPAQPAPPTAMAATPAQPQPPAAPVAPVTRQASPSPAPPPAQMQAAAPSPPPFTSPQPVQQAAPAAAVPVPSLAGSTPAPAGRAAAVPVPPSTPGGPTPSPLTAPISASPVPPGVPTPRQTVQASEPLPPSYSPPPSAAPYNPPAASAAPYSPPSQTAAALPSRPGAQVDPGGAAALPSGFVPGGGRTPLLAAVYAQSIAAQNARSVSDIPPGFRQPTAQPIGQFATEVPQIVQQSFNTAIGQMPPAMTPTGQPARGGSVGAALIHFDEGSTRVSPKTRDLLAGVVQQQREMGGRLRVVGHANGAGTREGARRPADVSLARAQSVSRELARLGVPSSAIMTEALGDSRPIFDESTSAGAAENRRVEIFLEP